MFELDVRSRKPIYEQLTDKVKEMILHGILQTDEQLPSVRTLSQQLTVNPNTIQKAYRELEREGYIYSLQGKGSFVAPMKKEQNEIKKAEVRDELLRLMAEAVYLGFTAAEISSLYRQVEKQREGGRVMIEIRGVSKLFQGEKAVDDISLTVHKGTIYGLLGSNGAGKTTLLKTLAGIYFPDKGTVKVDGEAVFEHPTTKQRVIFMPDSPYFFPQSNMLQMAAFYRSIYPSWNQKRFEDLGTVFQLDKKRKLSRFSKGMQRQASFWLCLSCMPDVLIMDEPIDGLDPVMRRQIKNLLFQEVAERELTVIISSHNLREIEDLCDHVGIMHGGKMLIEKDLDDLKADTHKIQVAFRDERHEIPISAKLQILHQERRGSVNLYIVKGDRERIKAAFQVYEPYVFDLLPLTLEEIFIYEMGDVGYDAQPVLL